MNRPSSRVVQFEMAGGADHAGQVRTGRERLLTRSGQHHGACRGPPWLRDSPSRSSAKVPIVSALRLDGLSIVRVATASHLVAQRVIGGGLVHRHRRGLGGPLRAGGGRRVTMRRCLDATVAFLSFRLGGPDGVSVVAETWQRAFEDLGFRTRTVGGGPVDRTIAGLAIDATTPPATAELERALAGADLVVVENLLTIPMNLPASRVTAEVLRGRPALLHHHDPPWHRARFAHIELPVDDPAWGMPPSATWPRRSWLSGIRADVVYNALDVDVPSGDSTARTSVRRSSTSIRRPAAPARCGPSSARTSRRPWPSPLPSVARTGCRARRGGLRTDAAAPPRRRRSPCGGHRSLTPTGPTSTPPRTPCSTLDLGRLRHPAPRGGGLRSPGRGR